MSTVGLREVAVRADVSPGTVSNFLNHPERVASATADRIRAAIRELNYVSNSAARQLRVGESTTIGHLAFEVGTPRFVDFARGAEERAAEAGYSVLIANSSGSSAREDSYLDLFESQRVRGVLLSSAGALSPRVAALSKRGIPVVAIGTRADTRVCSSVSIDDITGGRLAARHLLDVGRRRLLVVGGSFDTETIADRLDGARQAVAAVRGARLEVLEVPRRTIAAGREIGDEIRRRPRSERPDGIFAVNDLLAIGILHGLLEGSKLRVPEDVALVGYGDIDFAADAVVPLTSVRWRAEFFGRTALDLLLQEIARGPDAEHDRVVFQPELVVRRSSVPQA